jgi:ribosomal protein L30E
VIKLTEKVSPLQSAQIKDKIKNGEVKVGKKSVIQAEGKAHQKEDKKIVIPEKTHEALEKKAKAEGKTADEKAAEIIEQKAKDVFEGKINKYGFLHIEKALYEALGWAKGEDITVKITRTTNGIAIERA